MTHKKVTGGRISDPQGINACAESTGKKEYSDRLCHFQVLL